MEENPSRGQMIGAVGFAAVGLLISFLSGGGLLAGIAGIFLGGLLGFKAGESFDKPNEEPSLPVIPAAPRPIAPRAQGVMVEPDPLAPPRNNQTKDNAEEERMKAAQEAARKAEEEANRKAQEEKKRAEEEARRKAEEEAKRKAEEEKSRAAEEAARRKAEEQARKKAEEAAKKAEEEAKRKSEDETRRKAQEQAKKQAEEKARREAEEQAKREKNKKQPQPKPKDYNWFKTPQDMLAIANAQVAGNKDKDAKPLPGVDTIQPTMQGTRDLQWYRGLKHPYVHINAQMRQVPAEDIDKLAKAIKDIEGAALVKTQDAYGEVYCLTQDRDGKRESWYVVRNHLDDSPDNIQLINRHSIYVHESFSTERDFNENIKTYLSKHFDKQREERLDDQKKLDKEIIQHLKDEFAHHPTAKFMEIIPVEGFKHALVIERGNEKEVWYLKSTNSGNAQFVNGSDPTSFFGVEKYSSSHAIIDTIERIKNDRAAEKADAAQAGAFDLPRTRPIGYIGLSGMNDKKNAESFKNELNLMNAMPEMLARCGYHMVCADDTKRVIPLYENPSQTLEKQIGELYKRGVRDFYIDLMAHGNPNGVYPKWDNNNKGKDKDNDSKEKDTLRSTLASSEVQNILYKYYDCNFTINNSGCHGGGTIGMMGRFVDYSNLAPGRVTAIAQTKENTFNYSCYNEILISLLHDMAEGKEGAPKTFGEAHREADKRTRVRQLPVMVDPEFWQSMPAQPSRRTAQNGEFDSILSGLAQMDAASQESSLNAVRAQAQLPTLVNAKQNGIS